MTLVMGCKEASLPAQDFFEILVKGMNSGCYARMSKAHSAQVKRSFTLCSHEPHDFVKKTSKEVFWRLKLSFAQLRVSRGILGAYHKRLGCFFVAALPDTVFFRSLPYNMLSTKGVAMVVRNAMKTMAEYTLFVMAPSVMPYSPIMRATSPRGIMPTPIIFASPDEKPSLL